MTAEDWMMIFACIFIFVMLIGIVVYFYFHLQELRASPFYPDRENYDDDVESGITTVSNDIEENEAFEHCFGDLKLVKVDEKMSA